MSSVAQDVARYVQLLMDKGRAAAKSLITPVCNVNGYGARGDGRTDDTEAIKAAVAEAKATGRSVFWPDGTYVTTGPIPYLHEVRHLGAGAIKRGENLFYPQPTEAHTNRIYVSPDGDGDGLSANEPASVQAALDALANYGPELAGTWHIVFAPGTYPGGYLVQGIRSRQRIVFEGPDVGGHPNEPIAIIDGSLGIHENGLYIQNFMNVLVKDLKFTNWASSGLVVEYHSNVWTVNVHASGCQWAGININNATKIYVTGGVFKNNRKGIRVYDNSMVSIGYGGSATENRPQITDNTEFGVEVRDSSSGHVDYCDIERNSVAGLQVWNQSRVASDYAAFRNNPIGIRCQTFSTWATATSVTFENNGKNLVYYWSTHSSKQDFYYDEPTARFRFGVAGYSTPAVKFHFAGDDALSGSRYNSNVKMALDGNGPTTYFGLSGPTASTLGVTFSDPTRSVAGALQYNLADDSLRVWLNDTDTYRLRTDALVPTADNAKNLGTAANRWTQLYAASGTINTSDEREKQQIGPIPDEVLDAWAEVEFCQFKFNDAVEQKGPNGARWHFGLIGQQVKEAFERNGLDPFAYGLLCRDEWAERPEEKDDEGNVIAPHRPAGERYGIRYEEALVLEVALMRRELNRMKAKLDEGV
ncbi:MAG: hypothetical protein CWE10_04645 [Symbiobacterium thermophilum]|uniref:Peptidase S74 domain-containing protein n=1 Tax=Symbiobacterium thermophilum TaxID=2734 RepID=A0A953IA05_SYMTR|nr:hypothetical protein [Symbiobacterium thermophilum]